MKAMIFAAGLGTRLKPFTEHHPKALVPVGGVPMLQRVLTNIANAGIHDVVVNVHHFATQITDFLATNNNFGLNVTISNETDLLLDTGGGLLKAKELLLKGNSSEPILLHNADIMTDLPLKVLIEEYNYNNADIMLLCSHRKSSRTLYFSKEDNRLLGWQNLSTGELKPANFQPSDDADPSPFNGVHIVSPRLFPLLETFAEGDIKPFSIVPFYLANIANLKIKRMLLPDGYSWFDVGSSEKLSAAEEAIARK